MLTPLNLFSKTNTTTLIHSPVKLTQMPSLNFVNSETVRSSNKNKILPLQIVPDEKDIKRAMKPKGNMYLIKELKNLLFDQKKCKRAIALLSVLILYLEGEVTLHKVFEVFQQIDPTKLE